MPIIMTGSIFVPANLCLTEKKHLDIAGIEHRPPVWQAPALSISPCLLGHLTYLELRFLKI